MQPYKIEVYVYAENEAEAKEVQKAAYDFVAHQYQQGSIVTAKKLTGLLTKYKDNFFVKNFLRQ